MFVQNTYIDILNKASTTEFLSIADKFPNLSGDVNHTLSFLNEYNNFLGINIGNSPSYMVSEAWNAEGGIQWLLVIAAFIIPVLSAVTQWINTKLMPQAENTNQNDQQNTMAQSMKMMNTMMPLMSAFFCYTLPAGMGLYWIAGSVVRSIQQVVINKHIDKMDIDALVKQNEGKKNQILHSHSFKQKSTRNIFSLHHILITHSLSLEMQDHPKQLPFNHTSTFSR